MQSFSEQWSTPSNFLSTLFHDEWITTCMYYACIYRILTVVWVQPIRRRSSIRSPILHQSIGVPLLRSPLTPPTSIWWLQTSFNEVINKRFKRKEIRRVKCLSIFLLTHLLHSAFLLDPLNRISYRAFLNSNWRSCRPNIPEQTHSLEWSPPSSSFLSLSSPNDAACNRQFPSPVVERGHNFAPIEFHQLRWPANSEISLKYPTFNIKKNIFKKFTDVSSPISFVWALQWDLSQGKFGNRVVIDRDWEDRKRIQEELLSLLMWPYLKDTLLNIYNFPLIINALISTLTGK